MLLNKRRKIEEKYLQLLGASFPDGLTKQRIQYLFEWYNYKAEQYRFLSYANIFLGLSFPTFIALLNSGFLGTNGLFLTMLEVNEISKITSLFAIITTAITGYFTWLKPHEQWVRHRTTIEELKTETVKYMAQVNSSDFEQNIDDERIYIEKIESIINKELTGWEFLQIKKRKEENRINDVL